MTDFEKFLIKEEQIWINIIGEKDWRENKVYLVEEIIEFVNKYNATKANKHILELIDDASKKYENDDNEYKYTGYEIELVLTKLKQKIKASIQLDNEFIWSLIVEWAKQVPLEGPSMNFGTLSREGDLKVHKRICDLLNIEE